MADERNRVEEAAGRVVELEAELESAANASTGGDSLAYARAALHAWVDSVVGVVAAAGSGRVTLIHADGTRSGIASPDLAYRVTPPVRFD
ncbi:MAG TPA: hypothetical protein PKD92_14080 [Novosphingobium sp.]|nr:hypothetical protein [Novosphingobium sp.]